MPSSRLDWSDPSTQAVAFVTAFLAIVAAFLIFGGPCVWGGC